MTSKNLHLKNRPFLLKPAAKDYLWGGNRLNDDFSKGIDMEPLAETWECSTHPDGPSIVASGDYEGMTLIEVLEKHPDYLGIHPQEVMRGVYETKGEGEFGSISELPILIKFIDAKKDLSVQVHPDDNYALTYENGSLGKTEMWYVLDATNSAELVYGFYNDMDKEKLRKSLENGTVEKYLQRIPVKKDDVFLIESGTVHAIGEGALIAEIQENSNLTYRLYDYNRRDKNGNLRELHIDKALAVANLKGSASPRQPMRVLKYHRGYALELLCRCKYFQVERMLLNTERIRDMADFQTGSNSFQVFLCTEGCGTLTDQGKRQKTVINFFKGDCIFIPADSVSLKLHGKAQLLKVSC